MTHVHHDSSVPIQYTLYKLCLNNNIYLIIFNSEFADLVSKGVGPGEGVRFICTVQTFPNAPLVVEWFQKASGSDIFTSKGAGKILFINILKQLSICLGALVVRASAFRAEGQEFESQCHLVYGVAKDPSDLRDLLGRLSRMIENLIEG